MSKAKIKEIVFLAVLGLFAVLGIVGSIMLMTKSQEYVLIGVFGLIVVLAITALAVLHILKIGKGLWNYIPLAAVIGFGLIAITTSLSLKNVAPDPSVYDAPKLARILYDLLLAVGIVELLAGAGLVVFTIIKKPLSTKQINLLSLGLILIPVVVIAFTTFATNIATISNIVNQNDYSLTFLYKGNDVFIAATLLGIGALANYFISNKKVAKTISITLSSVTIFLAVIGFVVIGLGGGNTNITNNISCNIGVLIAGIASIVLNVIANKQDETKKVYHILNYVMMGISIYLFAAAIDIVGGYKPPYLDETTSMTAASAYVFNNIGLYLTSIAAFIIVLLFVYKDDKKKSHLLSLILGGALLVNAIINIANNNILGVVVLLGLGGLYKFIYMDEPTEQTSEEKQPLKIDYGMLTTIALSIVIGITYILSQFDQIINTLTKTPANQINKVLEGMTGDFVGIVFVLFALVVPTLTFVFTIIKKQRQPKLLTLTTLVTNFIACISILVLTLISVTNTASQPGYYGQEVATPIYN